MPKIKTLCRTSKIAMENSHSSNNYRRGCRNALHHKENLPLMSNNPKKLSSTLKTRQDADINSSSSIEAFECSLDLFPHLIYISDLTKDFVNRAAGVLEIPKNQFFLETAITFIQVYVSTSDSQSLHKRCTCRKPEAWPYILFISVCESEQVMVNDGILFVDKPKYKKINKMLEIKCLDTNTIRAAITHPDVREAHEAITELLEIPIWKLLIEIQQNNPKAAASPTLKMLHMELDILLNTVKHTASCNTTQKTAPACKVVSEIPEKLRNYLSRKREVFGFGIWNNDDFRVFVNHKDKERHLRQNLLTAYADFFAVKRLHVLVYQPCFFPHFQQGDKLYPRSLPSEDSKETVLYQREKSYGTLGGFVHGKSCDKYALTCSHVCQKESIVFAAHNDSEERKIGECVFSSNLQSEKKISTFCDVALVKIDGNVIDKCNLSMLNYHFNESKVKIYSENLSKIGKVFVYKIGATTSLTKGLISSSEYYDKMTDGRTELFVISDFGNVRFAEPGDSGSIVFTNENSSALDTINVIGLFWGEILLNPLPIKEVKTMALEENNATKGREDEEVKKEHIHQGHSICFRMDTALKYLEENGWNIRFKNQI